MALIVDLRSDICPYCYTKLRKIPGSKTLCRNCAQYIYVRTTTDKKIVTCTLTEAEEIDLYHKIKNLRNWILNQSYCNSVELLKYYEDYKKSLDQVGMKYDIYSLERAIYQYALINLNRDCYEDCHKHSLYQYLANLDEEQGLDPKINLELSEKFKQKYEA